MITDNEKEIMRSIIMTDIDKNWDYYLTSKRSDIGFKIDRFFKELVI